jgi:AcrR family transcriptional regulator
MAKALRQRKKSRGVGRPFGTDNDTRSIIIKTASALLEKTGIEDLSNKLICEASSISPPTLYHHFPDKKALLDALATQAFIEFLEDKKGHSKSTDPLVRFKEGWRNFSNFAASKPEHFRLMASATITRGMPSIAYQLYNYPTSDLEGIKKKHGLKIDVALAAQLTMSTAFGVCMLPMGAPEIPWEAGLSEAALEGLLQFILVRK